MRAALAIAALALCGCGSRTLPVELRHADELSDHSRYDEALPLYGSVLARHCAGGPANETDWTLRKVCGPAALGKANALAGAGRFPEAAAAFLAAVETVGGQGRVAARALERAADLYLRRLGDPVRAYDLDYRVLLLHPDSAAADDALRVIVADGRRRDEKALFGVLVDLAARLADTEIADNLLWEAAGLAADLGDPARAVRLLDELAETYPRSALRDDAYWRAAALLRASKDPAGALERLRRLLATRRRSLIIGSYDSIYLARAAIESGRITLEDLRDPGGAVTWFERARDDNPHSRERDDAQLWIAVAYDAAGRSAEACAALAELRRRFPESGHITRKGRVLGDKLGCKP